MNSFEQQEIYDAVARWQGHQMVDMVYPRPGEMRIIWREGPKRLYFNYIPPLVEHHMTFRWENGAWVRTSHGRINHRKNVDWRRTGRRASALAPTHSARDCMRNAECLDVWEEAEMLHRWLTERGARASGLGRVVQEQPGIPESNRAVAVDQ